MSDQEDQDRLEEPVGNVCPTCGNVPGELSSMLDAPPESVNWWKCDKCDADGSECDECDGTGRADNAQIYLRAEVTRLTQENEQALGYLSRLFQSWAPQCEPLPNLLGVCTQIDNYGTGLREENERLKAAIECLDSVRWDAEDKRLVDSFCARFGLIRG